MESLRFLKSSEAHSLRAAHGSPLYVYDARSIRCQAESILAFGAPYGLTVRFAMKACPSGAILRLLESLGLHFDASSIWEARRAMLNGIAPGKISISTQELPADFADLITKGVTLNACSLRQLEAYGKAFPGAYVGVRLNPGLGSGHTGKTNTGGPASSFGIWHEYLPQVKEIAARYGLKIYRAHSHVGSGGDPAIWEKVAIMNLDVVRQLPDVNVLNLGGGFKVARVPGEKSADIAAIGARVGQAIRKFAEETGRELFLELEPGTFIMANCGALLTTVQDCVDTGASGFNFLKLDAGMTEILRPSLYGSQHALVVVPQEPTEKTGDYVVVGHCCESGDLISCAPGEPETLAPRTLTHATPGDILVIEGAGAYCSGMPAKNYNSFPEIAEVLKEESGAFTLIRKKQTLEQVVQNEILPGF
ncbi:MAG: diaminopimelate decarboxylase [Verrucomicrobiota bacterium]|nr:diaminopimelate decarboxylase [Verrucomicrobiota bacterium]